MANHHYLPQFYLKGFADPEPPPKHVWVHRPEVAWERRHIKDVAAEAGYYSFRDDAGKETDELERLLSRVESVAANLIREKVARKKPLTTEERLELSVFIATMQARVPGQHDHIGEFVAKVGRTTLAVMAHAMKQDPGSWQELKQRYETKTGDKLPDDFSPEDLDPSHYRVTTNRQFSVALSFSAIEIVSRMIADKGWRFLVSTPPACFITSDYPFGVFDPMTEGTIYGPALASPKTEVTLPLTKTIALLAGGKMAGTEWVNATEKLVAQVNTRTGMRATFLVSPKPTAYGLRLNGSGQPPKPEP